jgi:opacity protein-like surface antigen
MGGWRVRAEYRYTNYGTSRELLNNQPFPFPLSLFPMSVATDFKLSTQTVLVGLGYIFN